MTQFEYMQEQARVKAKELYHTFHQGVEITHCNNEGILSVVHGRLKSEYAKQFAKISVDEIIKTKEPDQWMGVGFDNDPDYWEEVKIQIEQIEKEMDYHPDAGTNCGVCNGTIDLYGMCYCNSISPKDEDYYIPPARDFNKFLPNAKPNIPDYELTIDDFNLDAHPSYIQRIYDGFWIILAHSEQDYENKVNRIRRGDRKGFLTINTAKRKL